MSIDNYLALQRCDSSTAKYESEPPDSESEEFESQIDIPDSEESSHKALKSEEISESGIIYDAGWRLLSAQLPQVSRDEHKLLKLIWSLGWYNFVVLFKTQTLFALVDLGGSSFFSRGQRMDFKKKSKDLSTFFQIDQIDFPISPNNYLYQFRSIKK